MAVAEAFTPAWTHLALGFRIDELDVAYDEFLRLCACRYEDETYKRRMTGREP